MKQAAEGRPCYPYFLKCVEQAQVGFRGTVYTNNYYPGLPGTMSFTRKNCYFLQPFAMVCKWRIIAVCSYVAKTFGLLKRQRFWVSQAECREFDPRHPLCSRRNFLPAASSLLSNFGLRSLELNLRELPYSSTSAPRPCWIRGM